MRETESGKDVLRASSFVIDSDFVIRYSSFIFAQCRYAPIRRTSAFTAQSDSFKARTGETRCAGSMRSAFAGFEHANALVNVWQANRDCQTFAVRAFDGKFAAMFAHDAAHNQQPETGASGLGRKIRFEHTA